MLATAVQAEVAIAAAGKPAEAAAEQKPLVNGGPAKEES